MEVGRDELLVFYDRYLQRCNSTGSTSWASSSPMRSTVPRRA